eukprot:CAMPEP_0175096626 /NCGR_PEP_ID=MMETSP0086_2-20121207/4835_1 /TAXON_ID=136419 /ORGANISM="Unknown Unknown, Strain D1" /LENGTH=268 /DNA_ID=CAMNT_0016370045 /DNA_START=20 /DNA_END=826 /DNA_ORIENTATION=+
MTEEKKNSVALLIIDPQNDFHPGGSLAVANANEDSTKISEMIKNNLDQIGKIVVTLDSHHKMHIAHGCFWKNAEGKNPDPFTIITVKDIEAGTWTPSDPKHKDHALKYVQQLEANKRFAMCIWPEHCLIGTPGHSVTPFLNPALQEWAAHNLDTVDYLQKGENCLTEMYSALKADVVMADDKSTDINMNLIKELQQYEKVLVCGEALSHCVNFTTRDLAEHWPKDRMGSICILEDAASSVAGFEKEGEKFLADMKALGCTITKSTEVL